MAMAVLLGDLPSPLDDIVSGALGSDEKIRLILNSADQRRARSKWP
jgi:hypothetical protein